MSRLSSQDEAALQGMWEQVALDMDGIPNPVDALSPPGMVTTFRGNHFAVHTAEGSLLLEGSFTLDEAADPKAITWTDTMGSDAGKQLAAIYTLDGDAFTFIAADAGAPRPTDFRGGPGKTMRRFVRRPSR
jgi:uncharacterized protein (TIGR03067 family)